MLAMLTPHNPVFAWFCCWGTFRRTSVSLSAPSPRGELFQELNILDTRVPKWSRDHQVELPTAPKDTHQIHPPWLHLIMDPPAYNRVWG